jgi:6-phospho-beta-glucosidase
MKLCVLGCGLRTPLLLHGLIHSGLGIDEVALYDIDTERSQLMEVLGTHLAQGTSARIVSTPVLERAIQKSSFVISSIRVGNMKTRAADERLALECGFAGQETTGPAGFAMALRTIPVAIEYARIVQRKAPSAWIVSLANS